MKKYIIQSQKENKNKLKNKYSLEKKLFRAFLSVAPADEILERLGLSEKDDDELIKKEFATRQAANKKER